MLKRIAQHSGQTVTFPLLQYNEAPTRWREIADACAEARREGIDMYGQVVGRPVGVLFGLELTQHPFIGCASYDAIAGLPLGARAAAMRGSGGARCDPGGGGGCRRRPPHPQCPAASRYSMRWGTIPIIRRRSRNGSTGVAARRGVSMAAVAYDTMLAGDGRGIIFFPARNFTDGNLDTVHDMLGRDDTVLGLGDGGAHVGGICDASMQTYMLSYWTRDRKGARLGVPWVVQAMTSHTAGIAGFRDRGLVRPGYKADLNVIDYDNLRLHPPHAAYDLPAGGRRLSQTAEGYDATILSGLVTYRHGSFTGALPGRLVRGRRAMPA